MDRARLNLAAAVLCGIGSLASLLGALANRNRDRGALLSGLLRHDRLGRLGGRRLPGRDRSRRTRTGGRRRCQEGRMACRAASAEPRAPAMSRSDTSANWATSSCSARSVVADRTVSRNQLRKCGSASITPPPDEVGVGVGEVGGDREQARRSPIACCSKILSAISSPCLTVRAHLTCGLLARQRRDGVIGIPVSQIRQQVALEARLSDATLSASPTKPQLQVGTGWPSAEQAIHRNVHVSELAGHSRWRRESLDPVSMTPPPRPVPTIADTEERRAASTPNSWSWAYNAAALPSLL